MKKTLLIILGVTILLCVVGVWVYLLVFGTPKDSGDVFSDFGIGGSNEQIVPSTDFVVDTAPVTTEGAPQALKQLTSRPVAGAVFISGGIRYMERGTGYIYDIMFTTGNESQVSGTTIPRTTSAQFSEDGTRVVVSTESVGTEQFSVGTLGTDAEEGGSLFTKNLPLGAREVSFVDLTRIAYLETTTLGSGGVRYDIVAGTSSILFNIPLSDIRVLWGSKAWGETIYVYTTPTNTQYGSLYGVSKNGLDYVAPQELGLMGVRYDGGLVISGVRDLNLFSEGHDGVAIKQLPLYLFPEKCVVNPRLVRTLYCGATIQKPTGEYPDVWYKGIISLSDTLWMVDAASTEALLLSDFQSESGREIDVAQIGTNVDGTLIYFINKNDGSLWMFDTTI